MTYVYCLVRGSRKPVLRRATAGLPHAGPARAVDAGQGLWLIGADVSEAEYGEAAIMAGLPNLDWVSRRAMGHEAVVEQFLSAPAVLPMQLFTIFKTDDRAVEHVRKDRKRIDRILKRVAGQVEWGLRLSWDDEAARAAVEKAHSSGDREIGGAAYLARKRDLLDVNRVQLAEARAEATRVFQDLVKHATDGLRRAAVEQAAPRSRVLLDAAYLVPAKKAASFRAAVRQRTKRLGAVALAVSLTGPWPPYNFIDSPSRGVGRRDTPSARSRRRAAHES